ncbi:hypothetical protein P9744_10755 [Heyndrickxia coagulans]|nr:hypothetical protein [Heyndrickxia coagulans]
MDRLYDRYLNIIRPIKPWTNVYAMSRSIMAFSMLLTLVFNSSTTFFKNEEMLSKYRDTYSIFTMFPYEYIGLIKGLCIVILLLVIIGWRPQITGILHWWIAYSFQNSAITIDGGEQVAAVFTLLLIPITLTDPRKWHWSIENTNNNRRFELYYKSIAFVFLWLIRFQVALLYFHSILAKLSDEDWINGTAVYYYLNDPMYGLPNLLHSMFDFILDSKLVIIPTYLTLLTQFILVLGFMAPKKIWKYILLTGIFMHEIFALMLGLVSFSLNMLAVLILYLRPWENRFSLSFVTKLANRFSKVLNNTNQKKENDYGTEIKRI